MGMGFWIEWVLDGFWIEWDEDWAGAAVRSEELHLGVRVWVVDGKHGKKITHLAEEVVQRVLARTKSPHLCQYVRKFSHSL